MEVKPIKSEADYNNALKKIENFGTRVTVHQKVIN